MGPLQVLCITVDERMYDGQMCLAQKFTNIVWQVLRDDPTVVPSGCMTRVHNVDNM
jgi:hypothetical protein